METSIALPDPLPDDPEVVATALETASIFGVQGDAREAVRWVRRAAELAGDAGADDRAFALARAAADLVANLPAQAAPSAPPAAAPVAPAPVVAAAPVAPAPVAIAPAPVVAPSAPPVAATAAAVSQPALVAQPAPNVTASSPPPPPPPPPVIHAAARASNRPAAEASVSVSPIVPLGQSAPAFAGNATLPLHGAAPAALQALAAQQVAAAPIAAAAPPAQAPVAPAPAAAFAPAPAAAFAPAPAAAFALAPTAAFAPVAAVPVAAAPLAPAPIVAPAAAPPAFAPAPGAAFAPAPVAPIVTASAPALAPVNGSNGNGAATAEGAANFQRLAHAFHDGAAVPQAPAQPPPLPAAAYEPVPVRPAFSDDAYAANSAPAAPPLDSLLRDAARTAARASIEASQEEGVYIVRLLKTEEAAPEGAHEALVVLVDPNSDLFDAT